MMLSYFEKVLALIWPFWSARNSSNTCEIVLVGLVVSMIVPPGLLLVRIKLWHEPGVVLNGLHAVVHGNASVKFDPLAGVPHEGKIELGVTNQLHASELFLESRRNGIGSRAGVNGNEVARRANPFCRYVRDVIGL